VNKCKFIHVWSVNRCKFLHMWSVNWRKFIHVWSSQYFTLLVREWRKSSMGLRWRRVWEWGGRPCCTGLLPDLCYCRRGGRRGFGCAREVVEAQGRSPFLARGRSPSKKVGGVRRGFGGYKRVCWRSREVNVERGQRMSLKLRGRSMTKEGKIRAIEP